MCTNDVPMLVQCFFTVVPDESYEGLVELFHDNGRLKYRGNFAEGIRIGQHIEYWENGNVLELSYWKDGWIVGTALRFHENGVRYEEEYYSEDGSKDGSRTCRTYSEDEDKMIIVTEFGPEGSKEVWVDEDYAKSRPPVDPSIAEDAVRKWKERRKNRKKS